MHHQVSQLTGEPTHHAPVQGPQGAQADVPPQKVVTQGV